MALFGSVLPTIIGTVLAYSVLRVDNFTTAVAVGCSFGPTSAGIALEVLQPCGVLATPLGQLIVATAIIDDIIALVVLNNGCGNDNYGGGVKAAAIAVPIVSALGLVVCGWRHCPLRHMPKLLAQLDHLEQRTVLACRRFDQRSNGTNHHDDDTTVKNNTVVLPLIRLLLANIRNNNKNENWSTWCYCWSPCCLASTILDRRPCWELFWPA
jgi:hypothetical protein